MDPEEEISTTITNIIYLEGATYDDLAEVKTFHQLFQPEQEKSQLNTIHFKYVKLHGSNFKQQILEYGSDNIKSIIFEHVEITGKIEPIYLPNLKLFSLTDVSMRDEDGSYELKDHLFFNKNHRDDWDWTEIWNLDVDIEVEDGFRVIRLNHSTNELRWEYFAHFEQVLQGCRNVIERLTLHEIKLTHDQFPTNLTYLKMHIAKESTSLAWKDLENHINNNQRLMELHLTMVMDEITISNFPATLKTLVLIGKPRINFQSGFTLFGLDKLAFVGVTLLNEDINNISKLFNTKRLGFLKSTRMINSSRWSGPGNQISYENLGSVLKIKDLEYLFIKSFEQNSTCQQHLLEIKEIVNKSKLYANSEGLVLQKMNGEWIGHRLFQEEESFAEAMFANDVDFKFEFSSAKCVTHDCKVGLHKGKGWLKIESGNFRPHPGRGLAGLLKVFEPSTDIDRIERVCFDLNQNGEIDTTFMEEFLSKVTGLEMVEFKNQIISKVIPGVELSVYSKHFEPRRYTPIDLSMLPSSVASLKLDNTLFKKKSKRHLVMHHLALSSCFLERPLFTGFAENFLVKQIAISPSPSLDATQILSYYLKHYEDGIANFDFNDDANNLIGVNHELLYYILKSDAIETIVMKGFDIKFQCSVRNEMIQFLKSAGVMEWELSFMLQRKRNGCWQGLALSSTDIILQRALNAEHIHYLMPEVSEETAYASSSVEDHIQEILDHDGRIEFKTIDVVHDGLKNIPKTSRTSVVPSHVKTPVSNFTGFIDIESDRILIEDSIINAEILNLELTKLDPFKVVEIQLVNVQLDGEISQIEFPNVRKFHLDTKKAVTVTTTDLPRHDLLKKCLFFAPNRSIEHIFKTTEINLSINNGICLEINRREGRIVSKHIPFNHPYEGGGYTNKSVEFANEILAYGLDETITFLHLDRSSSDDELNPKLIRAKNNVKVLILSYACSWPTTECILQKLHNLEQLVCSTTDHDPVIHLDLFPETLQNLTIERVDWKLVPVPSQPIEVQSVSFVFCTFGPDFNFHQFFNVKQAFFYSTFPSMERHLGMGVDPQPWQTIQFLNSILMSSNIGFLFFDNFSHRSTTIFQHPDFNMSMLNDPTSLALLSIAPVESPLLQAAGASQWDSKLTLIKKDAGWKCIHFMKFPERFQVYRTCHFVDYSMAIYKNASVLAEQPIFFKTLLSIDNTTIQSITISNAVLNASDFIQQLKNLPDAAKQLNSIKLTNVKLLGDFPPFQLPRLKDFIVNLAPCDKLKAEIGVIWSCFKHLLFFHGSRPFVQLWSTSINVCISIGQEKLFEINHSTQSFLSRIENSNHILNGIASCSILGLNCKINPVAIPKGLKILRLENVVMTWEEVVQGVMAGSNASSLEELHFSPTRTRTHPRLKIVLGKFPSLLRVLSLGGVQIEFHEAYETLQLDTLILHTCSFTQPPEIISRNFGQYFNIKRFGSVHCSLSKPYFIYNMLLMQQESYLEYLESDTFTTPECVDESIEENKMIQEKSKAFLMNLGIVEKTHCESRSYLALKKNEQGVWIRGEEKDTNWTNDLDYKDLQIGNDVVSQLFRTTTVGDVEEA